jgi:hypothetical protein
MLKSLSRHRIYFVWIIIVQDGVRMPLPSRASEEQTDGVCVVDNAGMCGLHLSAHAVYICLNPYHGVDNVAWAHDMRVVLAHVPEGRPPRRGR